MMNNLSEGFGIVVNETVFTRMMDAITDTEDKEIFEDEFCPRLDDEYFLGFSIGFGEFYGIWKFTFLSIFCYAIYVFSCKIYFFWSF